MKGISYRSFVFDHRRRGRSDRIELSLTCLFKSILLGFLTVSILACSSETSSSETEALNGVWVSTDTFFQRRDFIIADYRSSTIFAIEADKIKGIEQLEPSEDGLFYVPKLGEVNIVPLEDGLAVELEIYGQKRTEVLELIDQNTFKVNKSTYVRADERISDAFMDALSFVDNPEPTVRLHDMLRKKDEAGVAKAILDGAWVDAITSDYDMERESGKDTRRVPKFNAVYKSIEYGNSLQTTLDLMQYSILLPPVVYLSEQRPELFPWPVKKVTNQIGTKYGVYEEGADLFWQKYFDTYGFSIYEYAFSVFRGKAGNQMINWKASHLKATKSIPKRWLLELSERAFLYKTDTEMAELLRASGIDQIPSEHWSDSRYRGLVEFAKRQKYTQTIAVLESASTAP